MYKVTFSHIKLCKTSSLWVPYQLFKKPLTFGISLKYVTQSNAKSSTPIVTHISDENGPSLQPHKPKNVPSWRPTPSTDRSNIIKHYLKLSKIRLTTMVVITSMAGYAVAPAPFEWTTFAMCSLGTGLLSAAANSVNQFHEVPFDAQMSRTKNRIIVCGRLTPLQSMVFASMTSLSGVGILYFGVNGLTASLGLANLILYTSIYTPMKRMSILNTWVGSIVGAMPPLMGWAACTGSLISPGAWLMAALLYSWQFPHFNALSWNLRPDYSRAGYRMMAVTEPALCRRVALRHAVALQGISMAAPITGTTTWWFLLGATPLNLYFIYLAYQFYKDSSSASSRKLFRFSLIHLPLIMILFLVNKKKWFIFEKENNHDDQPDHKKTDDR
ncbi:unnamed protein product [Phaedon cochleariae]|uniref:Protoheme IX farnesyltransferase, mitochondrial n=1 Tax=Phaedon cochleariae TaxID=80249 RepID=A0A9N9X497_PHACE|nr:unnamed protein product [Phaedon cochleariae]